MALYDPVYGYSGQPMIQFQPGLAQPPQPQPAIQQPPFVKVVTVAGETAAKSLKLAPGSTLLAADENDSVIWFIKANDVGPNTVSQIPFDPAIFSGGCSIPSDELSAIKKQLSEMDERMKQYESNVGSDKQHSGNNSNNRR